tara:strand:+ start:178 stop:546 length:369 start_codon:yes stop_codon:yes gene_type:complete
MGKSSLLPQEVEVWYLIPAIRRELAKILVSKGKSQKEISEILNLTESAVSQYLKGKRGGELDFSINEKKIINEYADKILKNPNEVKKLLFELTKELGISDKLCDIHRKHDSSVGKNCDICMK